MVQAMTFRPSQVKRAKRRAQLGLLLSIAMLGVAVEATEVGQPLPSTLGNSRSGELIVPQDWQGKVAVISFWASWCPPCNLELPYLKQIQSQWGSEQVQVVALNYLEAASELASHSHRFDDTSIIQGWDEKGSLSQQLGVNGIPHTLIVDKNGKVAHIHSGFYKGTGEQMLAEVEALLNQP